MHVPLLLAMTADALADPFTQIDCAGGLEVVELDGRVQSRAGPSAIRMGVHRTGPPPDDHLDDFDLLLSTAPDAARPWVWAPADAVDALIAEIEAEVARCPIAATILTQILRMTLDLSFDNALVVESLGYSALLGGAEFRAWRARTPVQPRSRDNEERVRLTREGDVVHVILARPAARNAVDARMRDALFEALEFGLLDPDATPMILSGEGAAFSIGGDLAEFGQAKDLSMAHVIRTERSSVRVIHQIQQRVTARLHGPCIGAGIEIPAACGRVAAASRAWFQLPEVSMGLIPGAGGTVTIPRRIGRHRACFMALSGRRIDPSSALRWGLIDSIEAP